MNWLNEMLQSDPDPAETREWIESIKAVIDAEGPLRAHQLLEGMVELTRRSGAFLPFSPTTEYVNTIAPGLEAKSPGDAAIEWRLRSIIRWNAMATVVRANRKPGDLGGHIASFASGATLYDVGWITYPDSVPPSSLGEAAKAYIRREFGTNIMVNAAHASDSPESVKREMGILKPEEDCILPWCKKYYA